LKIGTPNEVDDQDDLSQKSYDALAHYQRIYEDELVDKIDFSDDDEENGDGSMTIRNASKYLAPPPKKGVPQHGDLR
jgi:hypothetical protein